MTTMQPWFPSAAGPPDFVLDVSAAFSWPLAGNYSPYASGLMMRMMSSIAAVPGTWASELAQMLRDAERAGRGTTSKSDLFLQGIHRFAIHVDAEVSARAWSDILPLARAYSIPVARAAYLELALRLKLPLATTDTTLSRSALVAGVPIYAP